MSRGSIILWIWKEKPSGGGVDTHWPRGSLGSVEDRAQVKNLHCSRQASKGGDFLCAGNLSSRVLGW